MASDKRTPGLSAFSRSTITSAQYASHGSQLRSSHTTALQNQLAVFQASLHEFSKSHGREIRSNPTFRAEFARMCNAIGVDPLVSSNTSQLGASEKNGSFWAQMLGGSVNDFYFELAVRVVEVCRETRAENGGMIAVDEVARRVKKGKAIGGEMKVSDDDILRAVKALEPLGSGYAVIYLGSRQMIRSVPKELNPDQSVVLGVLQDLGCVTQSLLEDNFGWDAARTMTVLSDLVKDSLVWIDKQAPETEYWTATRIQDFVA